MEVDSIAPPARTVAKVAKKVRTRRASLELDQDLARYGGPSRSTVGLLENKHVWPLRERTRVAWARVLRWEADAFDRMARGQEPVELNGAPTNNDGEIVALVRRLRDLADEALGLLED